MEDQDDKMEALKKAYADIILNTAKEAAARAMVSEHKALRLHHNLRDTKEEALQMMLRLKNMIDAKTTETEMTAFCQQKRIDELDNQLNEAVEVIVDLRAELRKAHERLEEVKNNHMLQSNEPSEKEHMVHYKNTSHEKKLDSTEQFRSYSQSGSCCNPVNETAASGNPNLAFTIIGSKESQLYKNGYTHRIRAIERNLVDEKGISCDKPAHDIKELIITVDEKSSQSSIDAKNTDMKNVNRSEVLSINSNLTKDQPVNSQRFPRNSVRYAKSNHKLSRFHRGQSINPTTGTEKLISLGRDEKLTENDAQSACTLRRSIRKRKVRCWDDISALFKSRAALSRCRKNSGDDSMKVDKHQYESKLLNASEETKDGVVEKQEIGAKESAGISSCNLITESDKILGTDSIVAEHSGGSADKKTILKYTFSRKRKRDSLSKSDNNFSPGKSFLTQKKPDLMEDTSSDTQNMVDIACQLISLSGKRSL